MSIDGSDGVRMPGNNRETETGDGPTPSGVWNLGTEESYHGVSFVRGQRGTMQGHRLLAPELPPVLTITSCKEHTQPCPRI